MERYLSRDPSVRVVNVGAGPLCQPRPNLVVLLGAVVVHDQLDVEIFGNGLLDLAQEAQEAQELLVTMARLELGDHLTGGHI